MFESRAKKADEQAAVCVGALAAVSLFALGGLSLLSGRQALHGGLRMLLIGAVAGLVSYGIGAWLGMQIG